MQDKYTDKKITIDGYEYMVLSSMEKDGQVYALIYDLLDQSDIRVVTIEEVENGVSVNQIDDSSILADLLLLANK